ncbi:MAG: glycosyltransferase family 2 protein, partial [Ignavibacterium sp.]
MIYDKKIVVIIPAFNEEQSLPKVINEMPDFVDEIIVANNGSTDNTEEVAKKLGVTVVTENERGYGAACLKAIDYIKNKNLSAGMQVYDIVVFLDGDYSDYPQEMSSIVEPIIKHNFDLVIGSRMLGKKEKGAMLPQAVFGNWLSTFLINLFWNYKFTELGPFRAIKYSSL